MNKSLTIAACVLWLVLVCTSIYAQSPSPVITPTPAPASPVTQQSDTEVAVLRAQLETMRQYDQRLLETVYWSLGATGGIVLLVVGLGWYTNFRLYERDKAALRKELLSSLGEEARSVAKTAVDQMNKDVKMLRHDLTKLQANAWEAKGVYENVLIDYVEMIRIAQELNRDYLIGRTLEDMQRVMKARAKKIADLPEEIPRPEFEAQLSIEITEMLDSLPKNYSAIVENIRKLLREQ